VPSKFSAERTSADNPAERPIRERQLAAYHRALHYIKGFRVLELGCGEGIGSYLLAEKAACVVAVDYSEEALYSARLRYGDRGIDFRFMKVPPIDFREASFDAVICFQMIEHLDTPQKLVAEVQRVLVNDGLALFATVNKEESITQNPYHLHEFGAHELKDLLLSHFPQVEMYGVFGDELFARYWENNRKWAANFMRLDVFGLAKHLPHKLKAPLFDAASRLMRTRLEQHDPRLCSTITYKNFAFQADSFEGCLDFFAVCQK